MLEFLHRGRVKSPRLRVLQHLALLSTLSPRERQVLDGLLHERRYLKGEIVFDQGEEGETLHIVVSGRVLICRQGEPVAGKINEILPGFAFGEIALLENAPRSYQARAEEDCVLASLSRGDLESLLDTNAAIASKLLLQIAIQLSRELVSASATVGQGPQ
ncbi:MAG: cyclic nucleotide-binding domain-containing protein [Betaproteobacteria bacterium]|nr:cyclic nucleotide-binding domain-containing protein [Betaproteobacteria bacterium]